MPSIVLIQEVIKIIIGFAGLYMGGQIHVLKKWTLRESAQLVLLPALIYTVQNLLCQTAYIYTDPLIFNLLNQTKTIWSAIFVYILMGKRQSMQQFMALCILFVCGARLSSASAEFSSSTNHSFWWGVVPVLVASICSGLGGGLSQRVLQKNNRPSLLYSIELSFYINMFLGLATILSLTNPSASASSDGDAFFRHWNPTTIIPIATNAMGGLLVGLVTLHAGTVKKGFAVAGGIIITAILRAVLFDEELSREVWLALPLVTGAMVLYTLYPVKKNTDTKRE